MARPTKLTPEVQETICKAIRIGATYQAAAEAAGVGYSTFNAWMKYEQPKYQKFREAVERANADAQLDLLAKVQTFGDKDWRANTWILEHRFKQDYGQTVDVTTKGEAINEIIIRYADSDNPPETAPGADPGQADPEKV
jgi:hypothetical protein